MLQGKKVTHSSFHEEQYLHIDGGIKTEDGEDYSCTFYNTYEYRLGWSEFNL